MSDDDDYMSDKFLEGTKNDTTSSLIFRHADKRNLELLKKKKENEQKNKPIKLIQQEKLEEGLTSAIDSSNKGFEMLMKMGYKPGQGIGKEKTGIVEPIPMEVKLNRHGLGKKSKKKASQETKSKLDTLNINDFRSRVGQLKQEQSVKYDLFKSQKVCEQLDGNLEVIEPREKWFWPLKPKEIKNDENEEEDSTESSEDDDELSDREKLEILTKYLRNKHFYCIWCGIQYKDYDDLTTECPGISRDEH